MTKIERLFIISRKIFYFVVLLLSPAAGLWYEYTNNSLPFTTETIFELYFTGILFFGTITLVSIMLYTVFHWKMPRLKTVLLAFLVSPFLVYGTWALLEASPWSKWFYIILFGAMAGIYIAREWHRPFSKGEVDTVTEKAYTTELRTLEQEMKEGKKLL
jgi:hypothetical protein